MTDAEDKESAPKTEEDSKKEEKAKTDWLTVILRVLPAIGIFTALLYFLGRIRTESYYSFLGISPQVLSFKIEDYMFSSFNLVIIVIVFTVFMWLSWRISKRRYALYLGMPINPYVTKKNKRKYQLYIIMFYIVSAASVIFGHFF